MVQPENRVLHPVVGPRLRPLLRLVLILFALLVVNSLYLASVTLLEQTTTDDYQDFLYLVMFLLHLLIGLLLIIPAILFGALHMRNAWQRRNHYAVRAGIGVYASALLLLISGVLLTRFGFLEINEPRTRQAIYWVHVLLPLAVAWLFMLHRLAGPGIKWRIGGYWGVAGIAVTAVLLVTTLVQDRVVLPVSRDLESSGDAAVPLWERWNDYGIGLLREGDRGSAKGELRQAEEVFVRVEALDGARGALNLARVYFKEGRLEETAAALGRAAIADPPAPPWTLAWYSALVDREYGNLDRAIATLEDLADTRYSEARRRGFDFSQDIRVLNELGRMLHDRSRQERGAAREPMRRALLQRAQSWLQRVLEIDPEDAKAHFNLSLVYSGLADTDAADRHRGLHDRYRRDDNAVEQAVTRHRRINPAANHAAEAITIYDLHRPGAPGIMVGGPVHGGKVSAK